MTLPTDAATLAVSCTGVEKSFQAGEQRVRVLRGAALTARSGELTYLLGPSGCGKTTLISVIGGILSCDAGTVQVYDVELTALKRRQLAKFRLQNLGFVFQQFNLIPALTARENVSVPLVAQGVANAMAERRADALLEQVGLGAFGYKQPAQLSGGQQQRVAIARALVHEPRLVICDEPTASLDGSSGQAVMGLLRQVALSPERAVLVVTHDTRILSYADSIHHMSDGVIQRTERKEASS